MAIQSSLLSMLAEQIKTPLTTLKLLIFKSPMRDSLNPQLARIEHIVDTVALMDSVKRDTQVKEKIDIANLVEVQWQHAQSMTDDAQPLQLNVHGNSVCLANRWALSIIFNNLISNAITYSTSPNVDIMIRQLHNKTQIVIKNPSVNLSADEKQALTSKYYRATNKAGHRGTGLGLWISKTLSEANNGALHVSQNDGEFVARLDINL